MTNRSFFKKTFFAIMLLALPSCKWFSKNQDGLECSSCCSGDSSATLLSMNGKPLLTQHEFEGLINDITESNEQARMYVQLIPDFKEQFFKAKKQALVISEWSKRNGIRNTDEYRKKENRMIEAIKESLDSEEFIKRHPVEVSDEDAKKYYEENKDKDPRIVSSAAGVRTVGVSFDNSTKASEFAKKVKASGVKNFDSLAKEQKLNVTSFGTINEDSYVDKAVKEKALAAKHFPDLSMVKGENNKYWVIVVKSKEKGKYKSFEEVKPTIQHMLKPRKLEEMINTEIPNLEKEYKIEENKQYFENSRQEAQKAQEEQIQEMARQQANMPKAPSKELAHAQHAAPSTQAA